jgi:hypothetical protein
MYINFDVPVSYFGLTKTKTTRKGEKERKESTVILEPHIENGKIIHRRENMSFLTSFVVGNFPYSVLGKQGSSPINVSLTLLKHVKMIRETYDRTDKLSRFRSHLRLALR